MAGEANRHKQKMSSTPVVVGCTIAVIVMVVFVHSGVFQITIDGKPVGELSLRISFPAAVRKPAMPISNVRASRKERRKRMNLADERVVKRMTSRASTGVTGGKPNWQLTGVQARLPHSDKAITDLVILEEEFEKKGDFDENLYIDFWNNEVVKMEDEGMFSNTIEKQGLGEYNMGNEEMNGINFDFTADEELGAPPDEMMYGNGVDEASMMADMKYSEEMEKRKEESMEKEKKSLSMSVNKVPKLHYEYTTAMPASCPCVLEKGLSAGTCWEFYNKESKACFKRKCKVGFVCVQNAPEKLTCMKTLRTKKVTSNGDGTCSTVNANIEVYVPYAV